jgi:hypothetical protein
MAAVSKQGGERMGRGGSGPMLGGGGAGTTRSRVEGGAVTLARARRRQVTRIVTLRGEETGEGKGGDRWAGATMPRFESIQTDEVIQSLFEFKF